MKLSKDQYLLDVWNKVLEYMHTNENIDTQLINNFYKPCSLYELTEDKAILISPNIVNKQILQSQSDIISDCFVNILELDHRILIEVYKS